RDHLRRHRRRALGRGAARPAVRADAGRRGRPDRTRDADRGHTRPLARGMSLEQELEHTLAAAGRHARRGERPVAVMAAEPTAGARVYVVAFAGGDELAYLLVDEAGAPVTDPTLVRDAVSLTALAERAEEVSGAAVADELEQRFAAAAARLRGVG